MYLQNSRKTRKISSYYFLKYKLLRGYLWLYFTHNVLTVFGMLVKCIKHYWQVGGFLRVSQQECKLTYLQFLLSMFVMWKTVQNLLQEYEKIVVLWMVVSILVFIRYKMLVIWGFSNMSIKPLCSRSAGWYMPVSRTTGCQRWSVPWPIKLCVYASVLFSRSFFASLLIRDALLWELTNSSHLHNADSLMMWFLDLELVWWKCDHILWH